MSEKRKARTPVAAGESKLHPRHCDERAPRVLYASSSIGLGHVSKDLAIARQLRHLCPDVEIAWLAGHPAADVLRASGEEVLPEADHWRGASALAEKCLRHGQLNLVHYVYRSLPSWMANARLFRTICERQSIDVAIGNEAYEVDVPLVAHVLNLPCPFVMIFDFVGTDPMSDSPLERTGAWVLNAAWSLDGRTYGARYHSAVFIGEVEDIPSRPFGLGLVNRRRHAQRYYDIVGHVIDFDPDDFADRRAWRRRLGYGDQPLVVCSAGGTAVGRALLELCARAYPALRAGLPDVRMVLVCGPRVAPESIPAPQGVEVLGYVPRLYEHLACCDVAVGQCGASSTTELAALRRPFLYFPIEGHFEQEAVAHRLARYQAGRRMSLRHTAPADLAAAIKQEYGRVAGWRPLPVDGARRAAAHILDVLGRTGRTPSPRDRRLSPGPPRPPGRGGHVGEGPAPYGVSGEKI